MEDEEFMKDEVLKEVKQYKLDDVFRLGRYTFFMCLAAEFLILLQIGNMLYMMYVGAEPSLISCDDVLLSNITDRKERCDAYYKVKERTNCKPVMDIQFYSVNAEWNYVCAEAKQVKESISLQMLAVIPGSIMFGQLSDMYGRRQVMLYAIVFCVLFMTVTSITNSLFWFTLWRSFTQFFNGGLMAVQMVYTVENLPKKSRFWLTNLITWSPNMIVFAVMAWSTGHWRQLAHLSSVLAVPSWLLLFFLQESPRFLLQKHRHEEARRVLRKIVKFNGSQISEAQLTTLVDNEMKAIQEAQRKSKRYSYLHLFYTCKLTRYTLALALSLFTTSLLNYSLMFNMEKLSGSIYWNSIMMGLFRYAVNLLIIVADRRWLWLGRKLIHAFSEGLSIASLLLLVAIMWTGVTWLKWFMNATIIFVMGMTTLMYVTIGMLANELFPTGIRNLNFSFGQVFSRLGVVVSPQVFFLADIWPGLPYITMLVIASVDFLLFHLNVDETKGKPMRDHMPPKDESWLKRGKRSLELSELNGRTVEDGVQEAG